MGIAISAVILLVMLVLAVQACRWGARRVDAWVPERTADMLLMGIGSALVVIVLTLISASGDLNDNLAILLLLPPFAPLVGAFMVLAVYLNLRRWARRSRVPSRRRARRGHSGAHDVSWPRR